MTTPDSTQGQVVPTPTPVPVVAEEPTSTGTPAPVVTPPVEEKPIYWQQLEQLPESVRPLVEPTFKDWDANVAKRLQSVHSEYEPYKPLFDEYEADALVEAVQLAQALETDPQRFVQSIIEAYGIDLGQGAVSPPQSAPPVGEPDPAHLPDDPRFEALAQQQQLLEALAQTVIAEREQRTLAESTAQLDSVLNDLRTQYGEFDENYVLTHIANGVDPLQAVGLFQQAVQQYASQVNAPNVSAPQVIGQGGGYPSQQVDPTTLNNQDTEALIVQMLRNANQQG